MTNAVNGRGRALPTENSKLPGAIIAEAERQWLYTEEELMNSPSIANGMAPEEERLLRSKGVVFINSVGHMLKVPQTTITTASVFFHRFLMRYSLVSKASKPLHHYQIASVAIYVASKIEEHARRLKEIVIACCRVAQKNEKLVVDEQTKDYWRWRDTIQLHEDYMLELLCFDLTIEGPHVILKDFINKYHIYHNRELRDTAWAFINDSAMTPLCLLHPARTIAAAALYCAAKRAGVSFPDDARGRPWWEAEGVRGRELRETYNRMAAFYASTPGLAAAAGPDGPFVRDATPVDVDERFAKTRMRRDPAASSTPPGGDALLPPRDKRSGESTPREDERPVKRVRSETPVTASMEVANGRSPRMSEGSEEGEVEE